MTTDQIMLGLIATIAIAWFLIYRTPRLNTKQLRVLPEPTQTMEPQGTNESKERIYYHDERGVTVSSQAFSVKGKDFALKDVATYAIVQKQSGIGCGGSIVGILVFIYGFLALYSEGLNEAFGAEAEPIPTNTYIIGYSCWAVSAVIIIGSLWLSKHFATSSLLVKMGARSEEPVLVSKDKNYLNNIYSAMDIAVKKARQTDQA